MWTAIQLLVCAIFLAGAAFFVGRFFGKRRYLKLHEEMKALELSFKQMVEEMDLASNHNFRVVEKQSEDLAELLTIADKKILRVNDFLKELDETAADLKRKANVTMNSGEPYDLHADRKFKTEISQTFEQMQQRIGQLSACIEELTQLHCQAQKAGKSAEDDLDMVTLRNLIEDEVTKQISKQLGYLEQQLEPAPLLRNATNDRVVPIRQTGSGFSTRFVTPPESSDKNRGVKEIKEKSSPLVFAEEPRVPKAEMASHPKTDIPDPLPGTPLYEILRLAEEGMTLPQIARKMGMGKGEIELILNIYGSRIKMRNVV